MGHIHGITRDGQVLVGIEGMAWLLPSQIAVAAGRLGRCPSSRVHVPHTRCTPEAMPVPRRLALTAEAAVSAALLVSGCCPSSAGYHPEPFSRLAAVLQAFRRFYEVIGLGWVYAVTKLKPVLHPSPAATCPVARSFWQCASLPSALVQTASSCCFHVGPRIHLVLSFVGSTLSLLSVHALALQVEAIADAAYNVWAKYPPAPLWQALPGRRPGGAPRQGGLPRCHMPPSRAALLEEAFTQYPPPSYKRHSGSLGWPCVCLRLLCLFFMWCTVLCSMGSRGATEDPCEIKDW